jgi:hypothetical protein
MCTPVVVCRLIWAYAVLTGAYGVVFVVFSFLILLQEA